MAFDHDLFSFVDMPVGQWPLVLVTNPKNARFLAPTREPVQRMLNSSHIRMLVFSPHEITSIQLKIDGQKHFTPVAIDGGPLYVSPWTPKDYEFGLHTLQVLAIDSLGRSATFTQPFSLDGTPLPFEVIPQLLLLTDFGSLVRFLFIV